MSGAPACAEYARRMQRVVDHIDTHLGEPLVLADLSAVAHFSPFHHHRRFAAWMGETLATTCAGAGSKQPRCDC